MAKMTIGNHAPNTLPKNDLFPELNPDDYPEINFWTRESWAPYLQNGEKYAFRNNKEHVRRYLQFASGDIIPKSRVVQMSADQRSLWVKYRTQGTMPDTWSQAGADILEDFRTEMYRRYLELIYCKDHYKLALFAGDRYPSWIRHRAPLIVKVEDTQGGRVPVVEDEEDKPHMVRIPKRSRPAGVAADDVRLPQAKHLQLSQESSVAYLKSNHNATADQFAHKMLSE
ncbi:hypothetical protein TRAPUB_5728 [Trametes pubescens]|uniref:Uncharacterized protein n=1 Tax=Trametes pubescens TaxID=154538 RepID=A0A1M2V7S8_TRAPU|nr:hypothetical protein TRAPUB_5728 [Trametes pubescens]